VLDRSKLLNQLEQYTETIFFDISNEVNIAQQTWYHITHDAEFGKKIASISCPWLLPTWSEALGATYAINSIVSDYAIIGIDGSQVYPDRHQGTSCFLINTGAVILQYGQQAAVRFYSEPHVFLADEMEEAQQKEYIDCLREEFELNKAIELALQYNADQPIMLFDGSLIFWHLMNKEEKLADQFLQKYCNVLQRLYEQRSLYAAYISLPKSKELINLIRLQLCNLQPQGCVLYKEIDRLVDADLMQQVLKPYERTILFKNHAAIVADYPEQLRPYFFYLHTGNEIARVEIPAWIAENPKQVNEIASALMDQCIKGNGYPVVLAEAHEQAVIKSADREFFYQSMYHVGITLKKPLAMSQKSLRKRSMGI